MITDKGPLLLADTSINIDPSAEDIAEIAKMTANRVTKMLLELNQLLAMTIVF